MNVNVDIGLALNAREEAATYGTGVAARRALVTRLSLHRNTTAFAWALFRGELEDRYELVDDAFNIRYIISLRARNTANEEFIQATFECAFQFHALDHPHVSWDVATVTWTTDREMRTNLNSLMFYIRHRLNLVETGQPLPPPELAQQAGEESPPEADSPPSIEN